MPEAIKNATGAKTIVSGVIFSLTSVVDKEIAAPILLEGGDCPAGRGGTGRERMKSAECDLE